MYSRTAISAKKKRGANPPKKLPVAARATGVPSTAQTYTTIQLAVRSKNETTSPGTTGEDNETETTGAAIMIDIGNTDSANAATGSTGNTPADSTATTRADSTAKTTTPIQDMQIKDTPTRSSSLHLQRWWKITTTLHPLHPSLPQLHLLHHLLKALASLS